MIVAVVAVLVPAALTVLGRAFGRWADKLETFSASVDKRLDKMHEENGEHWKEANIRLTAQEKELYRIHVCVERRLARLEARDASHDR